MLSFIITKNIQFNFIIKGNYTIIFYRFKFTTRVYNIFTIKSKSNKKKIFPSKADSKNIYKAKLLNCLIFNYKIIVLL
jgi:hypothetical protein